MKTIIRILLCGVLSVIFVLNAAAQVNITAFIQNVEKRATVLNRHQNTSIETFMRYGYKKKPYLKDDSITKVPIYRIYNKQKLFHIGMTPDSLFEYLNPQSVALEQVFFYRGDSCINIGYPQYYKRKEQAVGVCYDKLAKIATSIIERNPKLMFSWAGDDAYFFLNQDSTLTCFLLTDNRKSYEELTPEEMIDVLKHRNSSDSTSFYWMSNQFNPEPWIYSK